MEFVELEKIYRQKDQSFIDLLNAVRTNTVHDRHMATLSERIVHDADHTRYDDFVGLRLPMHPRVKSMKTVCNRFLANCMFKGSTKSKVDAKQLPAEIELQLKVGARVMIVTNDPAGRFVNGTMGWVKKITDEGVVVTADDGLEVTVDAHKWDVHKYLYDQKARSFHRKGLYTQIRLSSRGRCHS